MRYIHDGTVRNPTVEPPKLFIVCEDTTHGRGRTDTSLLFADQIRKMRDSVPLIVGHDSGRWRWSDDT